MYPTTLSSCEGSDDKQKYSCHNQLSQLTQTYECGRSPQNILSYSNRLIQMHPSGTSEPTVVYKEPLFVDEALFLMNGLIREGPIEENSASECIRTVAATYYCKIYNHANMMRTFTDTTRTANDTLRIPLHANCE